MKQGFAITGIIYAMFLLFILVLMGNLSTNLMVKKVDDNSAGYRQNELENEVNRVYKEKGVNAPNWQDTGLIPVVWNGTAWEVANIYRSWYDYENRKWANVVSVTSASRNTYLNNPGRTVATGDILAHFVWIPRFKYAFPSGTGAREIAVVFETGEGTTGSTTTVAPLISAAVSIDSLYSNTSHATYITHPAFTFGSESLSGFWMGKFETGTTNANGTLAAACTDSTSCDITSVRIKPTTIGLGRQSVKSMFYMTRNLAKSNNTFGLNVLGDSHMIKSTEWGAAAYLSASRYGKGSAQTYTNNIVHKYSATVPSPLGNNLIITGCARADAATTTDDVTALTNPVCLNDYSSTIGIKASTTGNVYGIYDMVGGGWEYTMSAKCTTGSTATCNSSGDLSGIDIELGGFTAGDIANIHAKYIVKYTDIDNVRTPDTYNQSYDDYKIGDATYEARSSDATASNYGFTRTGNTANHWTSPWDLDFAYMPDTPQPWIVRGGSYGHTQVNATPTYTLQHNGLFAFSKKTGEALNYYTTRVIYIP